MAGREISEGALGRAVGISIAAALGGFLFGFDTAVINGAVGALQRHFAATPIELGLAVSAALIGSAVGAFFAGRIADRIGRARAMVVAGALFAVGSIGSGVPATLIDFSLWRFVGGLAVGGASVVAPAYIAEVSPAHLRGRLGSLQQLAIVLGIFVALLADYGFATAAGSASSDLWFGVEAWRWMFWSEVPPALLYAGFGLLLPESPRYLVARGRDAEAEEVLASLLGPATAREKVEEIRRTVEIEYTPRLADLRGPRGLLPVVWTGIGLSLLQQLVGINVIFYYSSVLWQAVGFAESDALAITVITSITNILTTLIAIATIDRFGRKPLLLAGSIGLSVTLLALAVLFGTAPVGPAGPVLHGVPAVAALVAANLYVFCFGFSWGPVVWVLLGEIFPNRIRAVALSVAAAAQWLANFAVSATFPTLQRAGLGLAYGLYTAFAVVSLFFVAFAVRETRGKELEEM